MRSLLHYNRLIHTKWQTYQAASCPSDVRVRGNIITSCPPSGPQGKTTELRKTGFSARFETTAHGMLCDSNDIYRQRGAKLLKREFLSYFMFLWITLSEFLFIAFIGLFTKIQKQGRNKARPRVLTVVILKIQVVWDFTLVSTPGPSSSGRMVCLAL